MLEKLFLILLTAATSYALISNTTELEVDENNRLKNNLLLFHGNKGCHSRLLQMHLAHREVLRMNDDLAIQFFGSNESTCAAVCLERGVHQEFLIHPLPKHILRYSSGLEDRIIENCQRVEIGFVNYAVPEAEVSWVDQSGQRFLINSMKVGERYTVWQTTSLGHLFHIVDKVTGKLLKALEVEHNAIIPVGSPKSQETPREVTSMVKQTFDREWGRAHVVTRTFTEFGFNKGRLPDDLWASLSAYHYNNRHNKILEEWNSKGLYVNWWEKDVYMIPMPWNLKRYWQSRLKTLVEEWSGVELELTDIYGMRRYEDGARLLTHVDREATHAASLIINVAQGEVREPWKVEIYDFQDRLHEIEMDEGDIVYYESARCLHGRMQPLEAAFYVNLFAHYRPIGDDKWYLRKNPEDAPNHAIDIGKCSTNGTKASCNGRYSVPYLSPTLEKLNGPDDLFNFWKKTTPTPSVKSEL